MTKDQKFELIKIILEKLLIGVLIGLAAVAGNLFIENYRSDAEFKNTLAREQATKIGETWEALNVFDYETLNYINKISEIRNEAAAKVDLKKEAERIDWMRASLEVYHSNYGAKHKSLVLLVYQNRFWLGDTRFCNMAGFANALLDVTISNLEGDPTKIDHASLKSKQLRRDIVATRTELITDKDASLGSAVVDCVLDTAQN